MMIPGFRGGTSRKLTAKLFQTNGVVMMLIVENTGMLGMDRVKLAMCSITTVSEMLLNFLTAQN